MRVGDFVPRGPNRRDFLRSIGKAGAGIALASLPLLDSCKGGGSTTPEPPPSPVPVNLQFKIYNHTQGLRGSFSKSGVQSGTALSLGASTLAAEHGIADVDTTRIAIRGENFGSLGVYKRADFATLIVPRIDTNYDIFLFNDAGAGYLYDWQDDLSARWNNWGMMYNRYPLGFYRKDLDGQTGEERIWGGEILPETGSYGVFDQLNNALKPDWAPFRYGFFDQRPTGTAGDSSYGFGLGYGREYWKSSHDFVVVNPNLLTTVPQQVAGGMAAVIESLIGWEDVTGVRTYVPIQTNGVLHQIGKDYFAFLFVRDPFTKNIA